MREYHYFVSYTYGTGSDLRFGNDEFTMIRPISSAKEIRLVTDFLRETNPDAVIVGFRLFDETQERTR